MFLKRSHQRSSCWPALGLSTLMLTMGVAAFAQAPAPLLTQPINNSVLVTLSGNTRPEAIPANDLGPVSDSLQLQHMFLQLKRGSQQEAALEGLIENLHNPSSPSFHQWLTASQFGQQFGLAQQDLATISGWLQSQGLTVNYVYPSAVLIDFSGTAGQIRAAFHTQIDNLSVNGVKHIANMTDPQIPAALAPAIVGVVSMNDFMPHPDYQAKPNYTTTINGATYYLVTPPDLAVIYNTNPLFKKGITGTGETVVVIEDTDVATTADWTNFRTVFGLSKFAKGTFTQVHPKGTGANNCTDPGANGNDIEAIIDAEYASASAPNAAIELASCTDTATFGGLIALQNLINDSSTPPSIVSISYGECEPALGAAGNASFNSTYQQAVTEGVSVFVSSGDEGAASCNANQSKATDGISVSGFTSTPYNVSVGGTDFGDTYEGTDSTYWNSTNTQYYESALSYIPEIPWNDSCASVLISSFEGFPQTYGTSGFCNSSTGAEFLTTGSGSGGPSGCATGTPSTRDVVSGTCAGYAKPSYQKNLLGNPADNVRDVPDVSLFSSNGVWSHFYPVCFSEEVSCSEPPNEWPGYGGTSFASPILAGIQALVNQAQGAAQGNPNYEYYRLAKKEYGTAGSTSCNSTLGSGVASNCVFYDVTLGDMDVNCTGTHDCYDPSGKNGVLSTSDSAYDPAYGTNTGWDFATGIGSVNATNLVASWSSVKGTTSPTSTPEAVSSK